VRWGSSTDGKHPRTRVEDQRGHDAAEAHAGGACATGARQRGRQGHGRLQRIREVQRGRRECSSIDGEGSARPHGSKASRNDHGGAVCRVVREGSRGCGGGGYGAAACRSDHRAKHHAGSEVRTHGCRVAGAGVCRSHLTRDLQSCDAIRPCRPRPHIAVRQRHEHAARRHLASTHAYLADPDRPRHRRWVPTAERCGTQRDEPDQRNRFKRFHVARFVE